MSELRTQIGSPPCQGGDQGVGARVRALKKTLWPEKRNAGIEPALR
jgi:hypothetical protein